MSKTSKRVRDKWRSKEWYEVQAPSYFGEQIVATIPSNQEADLRGRVVETTLYDITGDFAHQSTKLYFLITDVADGKAQTILKGHEYSTDFLRSLVRRGSTRLDAIFGVRSKNGYLSRLSAVAFTLDRIRATQEHEIRKIMRRTSEEKAQALTYEQLVHEIVLGKLGSDIYNLARKITPLRHVGIRKLKLLVMPSGVSSKGVQMMEEAETQ